MKKLTVLTAIFCICWQAVAVWAATPDYSGEWILDVSKSKLSEQSRIESMTLRVSQTAQSVSFDADVKRTSDAARGGTGRGGQPTTVYTLDEKETTAEIGGGIAASSETRKGKVTADGKLSLTSARTFKTGTTEGVIKSSETWELLDGGKTLKIVRYTETPRGGINQEFYFTKKTPGANDKKLMVGRVTDGSATSNNTGILNGKAISLPSPEYPAAARAVRASGAVNVQVTIDEEGNVISAGAVSGHPLLRQAAENAARSAKFSPTILEGSPVKVVGVVVYSFLP